MILLSEVNTISNNSDIDDLFRLRPSKVKKQNNEKSVKIILYHSNLRSRETVVSRKAVKLPEEPILLLLRT